MVLLSLLLSLNVWAAEPISCEGELAWNSHAEILHSGNDTYVGIKVDFPPIEKVRKELEHRIGHELKNRSEAHITILAPAEYLEVRKTLSEEELNHLLQKHEIGKEQILPVCVGKGEVLLDGKNEQTYFIAVVSHTGNKLRQQITAAVKAKRKDFSPLKPADLHITLGFTLHDLFGVAKDSSSCIYDIEN